MVFFFIFTNKLEFDMGEQKSNYIKLNIYMLKKYFEQGNRN